MVAEQLLCTVLTVLFMYATYIRAERYCLLGITINTKSDIHDTPYLHTVIDWYGAIVALPTQTNATKNSTNTDTGINIGASLSATHAGAGIRNVMYMSSFSA